MTTTEGAVRTSLSGDLFIVIGESEGAGRWGMRVYHKPMQVWLWIGSTIMVLGGLISLSDRRYRIGSPEGRKQAGGKRKSGKPLHAH